MLIKESRPRQVVVIRVLWTEGCVVNCVCKFTTSVSAFVVDVGKGVKRGCLGLPPGQTVNPVLGVRC